MMQNIVQSSLETRIAETRVDIQRAQNALDGLEYHSSDYARQITALSDVYQKVLHVYESALSEENEYVRQWGESHPVVSVIAK